MHGRGVGPGGRGRPLRLVWRPFPGSPARAYDRFVTLPLKVAVLGPGGVGGLLAALLARDGHDVTVLAGATTVAAIADRGISVESERFGVFNQRVRAATELSVPVEVCFVCAKATQLGEAVARVPATFVQDGLVVPVLNGFEHVDFLRSVYPPDAVIPATIRIESIRVSPGFVRQPSPFAALEIASGGAHHDEVERVAGALRAAGLDVRVRDDELGMLWDKFALLGPLALATTHARGNLGVVRTQHRHDMLALIEETAAVAAAEGVSVDTAAMMKLVDGGPAAMETSMLRDQVAGRPLEIDAIGGALLRRARKAGVPVPVTTRIVTELASRSDSPDFDLPR